MSLSLPSSRKPNLLPRVVGKFLAYAHLTRLPTSAAAAGLVLCFAFRSPREQIYPSLLSASSIFLILCGSFAVNDYYDREADAVNTPWRPIPRGAVSPSAALTFGMFLSACGLLLSLLTLSVVRAGLGVLFVTGALTYSPWIQRVVVLKNAWVAFLCSFLPLAGEGSFGYFSGQASGMLLVFTFIFQKELAADLLDSRGDSREQFQTLANSVGRTPVVLMIIVSNLVFSAALGLDSSRSSAARGVTLIVIGSNLVLSIALSCSYSKNFLWAYVRLQHFLLIFGFLYFFPGRLWPRGVIAWR